MTKKKKDWSKAFHVTGTIYYIIMILFFLLTMMVLAEWYVKIQSLMDMVP